MVILGIRKWEEKSSSADKIKLSTNEMFGVGLFKYISKNFILLNDISIMEMSHSLCLSPLNYNQ